MENKTQIGVLKSMRERKKHCIERIADFEKEKIEIELVIKKLEE